VQLRLGLPVQALVLEHALLASSRAFHVTRTASDEQAGRNTAFGRFDYEGAAV
jgi:hypothetical protein